MIEILPNLMRFGKQQDCPDYVNNKIQTTNVLALGLVMVAMGYIVLSLLFYPQLAYLPVVGLFLLFLGIGAGYLGLHFLYRTIISLVPVFIVFAYHEGIISAGSTPMASTTLLHGAFSLLPFILFDLREGKYLAFNSLVGFLSIVLFRYSDGWLEYGLDDSLFRTGPLHEITIALSMLLIYGSVFTLSGLNFKAEKESEKLLEESQRKNEELNRQQAATASNLLKLEKAQEEERKRAWASEGFSRFGTLMRESRDLQKTYDELVSGIVKYVDANQAGLYITEGEEGEVQLRLKACYAYERKKYHESTIQPGEGLVGQAYLERDYIYLTDIPNGYTHITSGLGHATPKALLILPLLNNNKVEGILEIAAFKPFEEHQISFLMQLGEDIASTININRVNEMTRMLLEKSQVQTEELRSQEEEMRQNMEEMEATQEELMRKFEENEKMKKDMDAYLQALDKAALMSEADLYGNIINVNDRFCEVAKYTREEVLGKPHNILRHPDNPKELFKEMWTNLKAGKVFKGRYPNRAKDGSTYWVDATIEPVLGPDGKPVKYIGIRFDVTEQVEREKEIEGLLEELDSKMWEMKMKEEQLQAYVDKLKETEQQEK